VMANCWSAVGLGWGMTMRVSARARSSEAWAKHGRERIRAVKIIRKIIRPTLWMQWLNFVHSVYSIATRGIDKGFCYISRHSLYRIEGLSRIHLQTNLGYPVCFGRSGNQGHRTQCDLVADHRVSFGAPGKAFCKRNLRGQFVELDAIYLFYIAKHGVTIEHKITEKGSFSQVFGCLPATQRLAEFRDHRRDGKHGNDIAGENFQVFGGLKAFSVPEHAGYGGIVRQAYSAELSRRLPVFAAQGEEHQFMIPCSWGIQWKSSKRIFTSWYFEP